MYFVVDLSSLLGAVVVIATGWLVARWKWREMVAREHDMRRRMALAAEESRRAELEAAASYHSHASVEPVLEAPVVSPGCLSAGSSPARQVLYECAFCGTPTTTRCKQCKAVHYCSGKCQIIHWRRGHKDECSILSVQRSFDAGVSSCVSEFNHGTDSERVEATEGVVLSYEQHLFSNSSKSKEKNEAETTDLQRTSVDVKTLSDVSLPSTILASSASALQRKSVELNGTARQSMRVNYASVEPTPSRFSPKSTGNCIVSSASDENSRSSTSTDCSLVGSEDPSLSEPSTPSCDFWEESVDLCNSEIHAVKSLGSGMNKVVAGGHSLTKDSTGLAAPKEVREHDFKLRMQPNSKLNCQGSPSSSSSDSSSNGKSQFSPSSVLENIYKEQKLSTHAFAFSNRQSLSKRHLEHENGRNGSILEVRRFQGTDSSKSEFSESHMSASTGYLKPSSLDVKSRESGKPCKNDMCTEGRYSEAAATRRSHFNSGIVGQLQTSNIFKRGSSSSALEIMSRHKVSFSYEHFVKLYNWNEVEFRPCGLMNCGNSCYANAVLQCLAFTPPLTAYFLQGLHSKDCHRKEWCFSCEFEDLVNKSRTDRYPVSPARIMSNIDSIASHLVHGREEDAHEFLRYAVDCMQLICLKEVGAKVPTAVDEETTLLGFTFGGYLRSKIECLRCGGPSEQHERMMDLAVEIGGDVSTLEGALGEFTHSEILDGENKYLCSRCKSYEKAKKRLRILEAPNVLTIALKRFQRGKFGKLTKRVVFPEILNLAPYMSGTSDKSPIYRLYGVVVHLDSGLSGGHYICYVKSSQGKWFEANDSRVEEVKPERVLSRDAYMLFYSRCSPRSSRLVRNLALPGDRKKAKSTSICKTRPLSRGSWDGSGAGLGDYLHHRRYSCSAEDESSSEYSSSFFSETSNGESSSTGECFDQRLNDLGNSWD